MQGRCLQTGECDDYLRTLRNSFKGNHDFLWRIHLPMQETWVQSLGQDDLLEKEMATHSSILAWESPWTEKPGGLQSMGSQSQIQLGNWTTTNNMHSFLKSNYVRIYPQSRFSFSSLEKKNKLSPSWTLLGCVIHGIKHFRQGQMTSLIDAPQMTPSPSSL